MRESENAFVLKKLTPNFCPEDGAPVGTFLPVLRWGTA